MKSFIISGCLVLWSLIVQAQQNYAAQLIPAGLLPYASAIIRDQQVNVEVKELNNVIYHVKEAITVFNKNGDDMAHVFIRYNKTNAIKYIKGQVYNEWGKQTAKFSEADFEDINAGNDFSLFETERAKHYLPALTQYPYTIVYEYETKSKQSLDIDDWRPNPYNGLAVEKSAYTFTCKPDFNIRYKEINIPGKVKISSNAQGFKTYTWAVSNLEAIKNEPYSPPRESYLCSVKIAIETFSFFDTNGTCKNWDDLGKWEYDKLIAGRQQLPPETIDYVNQLTRDISNPKLKAKKIYEYMQGKTHYISVQVGIGGWQPFLAGDVDKQNYGDCKALVNYMQALLKAVNIESYYCVVEAGRAYRVSLMNDFASMAQGNHIILCLPFKNDTTWADCTSQTIPFGYLGNFTDDRTALACTPEGGKLLHTPKYTKEDNIERRNANLTISATGELSGNMTTIFKGVNYEDRDELFNEAQPEQYKMLKRIYPINNLEVESFDLKQDKNFKPFVTETIKLRARDYASFTDGKFYFMLNPVNRINSVPRQVRNRVTDVYINRGTTDDDEVIYTIPAGYHSEKTPLQVAINKPFAKFAASMVLKGNQLIYKRKFELIDGTYSKDTYQDLVNFYQEVVDADDYNVVLVKNN